MPAVANHHDISVDLYSDACEDAEEQFMIGHGNCKLNENVRKGLRPPIIDVDLVQVGRETSKITIEQSSRETCIGIKHSISNVEVKSSSSGSSPCSPTSMSPSAIAAFKILGVSESESETDVDTTGLLSTDVETPSPHGQTTQTPLEVE